MQQRIVPALRNALETASLLCADASLLVAVSGGADSTALLCGLAVLRRDTPFRLAAVHVEHGLRGEASLRDEAFVRDLCTRLDIPLFCYHAELSGDMHRAGVENHARQARRHFFREAMADSSADAVLLAHHQDDQAETVLMRLLRGAGARGLGGMQPIQPFGRGVLLRPFLSLPRSTLTDALLAAGQPWREDESNAEPCTLRNQLRLHIMPQLEAYQPQAAAHMAQAAQRLRTDENCLQALAGECLGEARVLMPPCFTLRLDALMDAPEAVILRVLRTGYEQALAMVKENDIVPENVRMAQADSREKAPFLVEGEHSLSYNDTRRLYALCQDASSAVMNLPHGLCAEKTARYLHLRRQSGKPLQAAAVCEPVHVHAGKQQYVLGGNRFLLQPMQQGGSMPDGALTLPLTSEQLAGGLVLRHPLPGDVICPFGSNGSKLLRRYFTDYKVDRPFRAVWPVLAQGQNLLWVAGVGASEVTRLRENTQDVTRLFLLKSIDFLPFP